MKMDITIAVPGLPFNGESFHKQSLGGSETAGYYMARALAALGHRVTVFCNTEPVRCADVDYLPIDMFAKWVEFTPHDVCIVQRQPELIPFKCSARFTMLWCHDLGLKRYELSVKGSAWNFDKIAVLSQFMFDQYKDVYDLPDEALFLTRNGVDLATVAAIADANSKLEPRPGHNPLSLVFSARPERGLDVMFSEIMPRILKVEPNAKLHLASYFNPVNDLAGFYERCKQMGNALGNSVVYLGHLSKEDLYRTYQTAGVYVYPVPSRAAMGFDEVSCISVMEAQANGLPVVASSRGALPETLGPGAGTLITEEPFSKEFFDAFADATLKIMRDDATWIEMSKAGIARANTLDWSDVAKQWSAMFEETIRAKSADLGTLANHFYRRSDIYAARECLSRLPMDDEKTRFVREQIGAHFSFVDEKDGFKKQYESIGGTHDERVIDWSPREPRYFALRAWLAERLPANTVDEGRQEMKFAQPLHVLDYGCAHGGYATNLLKDLGPMIDITGVDIDMHGIELACRFAEKLGVADRFRGVVGDIDRLTDAHVPEMTEFYDVVLCQEVIEHVADPTALLKALESRVKDGGTIYLTIPSGPWEYSDYTRTWGGITKGYPHRAHIREFDVHDISDLLDVKGKDAGVVKQYMAYGHSPETGDPLGWWIVQYKVTEATRFKVGTLDMERKLWLQRPRETVSVAIMAGPGVEDTLHWCLKSLEHFADEVVIADCGMSEEAKRILLGYDSRVRVIADCPSPAVEGFETPRNIVLDRCTQDWVLWIDTDEKILNPAEITKYLRANMFQGYSIRQHHFAVDTHFDADMPVRLFRNNKQLKFFGMIHEHPEMELNKGPGKTLVISDVHIPHIGYLIESGRQVKFDRNYPMLQADIAKYPDRKLQKHFIMRDKMLLVSYSLRGSGGAVTQDIRDTCKEVQAIWREHFRGKGHFTNVDPIMYYSQATGILQEGFEVAFGISANKSQAGAPGISAVRFANEEDAVAELSHRAGDAVRPFTHKYY